MKVHLLSLEDFGLTTDSLKKLDKQMHVKISLRYPEVKPYISLSLKQRKSNLKTHFEKTTSSLIKKYSLTKVKLSSDDSQMGDTLECTLSSQNLLKLIENKKEISSVSIQKVEGMKKVKVKESPAEIWYVVRGLFVFQIQGKKSGKALTQEEFFLVKAKSADAAAKKTSTECKKEENLYFGGNLNIIRKKFIKIIDVNSILEDDIDPNKVNFLDSNLSETKITPGLAWK